LLDDGAFDFSINLENGRFEGFLKFIVNSSRREYQDLAVKGFVLSNRE